MKVSESLEMKINVPGVPSDQTVAGSSPAGRANKIKCLMRVVCKIDRNPKYTVYTPLVVAWENIERGLYRDCNTGQYYERIRGTGRNTWQCL